MQGNWRATGKGTKGLDHPDRKVTKTAGIISSHHCDVKKVYAFLGKKELLTRLVSMTELVKKYALFIIMRLASVIRKSALATLK